MKTALVSLAAGALLVAADIGAPGIDIKQPPPCSLNADFMIHPPMVCLGYNSYSMRLRSIATNPVNTQHRWETTSTNGFSETHNSGTVDTVVRTVTAVPGATFSTLHTVTRAGCATHTHTDDYTIPCPTLDAQFTSSVAWGHTTGMLTVTQRPNPRDTYWQFNLHQHGVSAPVAVMAWWQHNPNNRYEQGPFTFTQAINPANSYYVKHGVWSECRGWQEVRHSVVCPMSRLPAVSATLAGTLAAQPLSLGPLTTQHGTAPTYNAAGDAYLFASAHRLVLPHSAAVDPGLQFSFALSVKMATAAPHRTLVKKGQFVWMVAPTYTEEHIHLGDGFGDLIHAHDDQLPAFPANTWVCMGVTVSIDTHPGGKTRVGFYREGLLVGGQERVVPTQPDYPVWSTQPVLLGGDWTGEARNFHYWDTVVTQATMNTVCGCDSANLS